MRLGRLLQLLPLTVCIAGCGLAVHHDATLVGGGPEQATAQARGRIQATAAAAATANAHLAASSQPCECDATGK